MNDLISSVTLTNNSLKNVSMVQQNSSDALIELTAQNITIFNQTFNQVNGSYDYYLLNDFNLMSIIFRIGLQFNNTMINISGFQ